MAFLWLLGHPLTAEQQCSSASLLEAAEVRGAMKHTWDGYRQGFGAPVSMWLWHMYKEMDIYLGSHSAS